MSFIGLVFLGGIFLLVSRIFFLRFQNIEMFQKNLTMFNHVLDSQGDIIVDLSCQFNLIKYYFFAICSLIAF